MNEIQQVRTLEQVAMEIRGYTSAMLTNIIEIGRRMVEAKEMLPYGQFGDWIRDNTGYSSSTANNFMRLYQEYGAAQGSLFGAEVDCQTFGKLSYSKALALLALPAGEREEFVQTNDVDAMSTRELQQAIRERDEAREQLQEARKSLAATQEEKSRLERAAKVAEEDRDAAEKAAEKISDENDRLAEERDQANRRIKELENRPVEVAVERDEAAIEEAAREAKAKAEAEAEEKVSALQKKLEKAEAARDKLKEKVDKADADAAEKVSAAEKAADQIRQELESLRRQLQLADADVTAFGIHFTAGQKELLEAFASLDKIAERNMPTAQKLNGGFAKLLQILGSRVKALEERAAAAPIPGQTELGG